ncbi:MAG: hypothetical protein F4Y28_07345 [Acidimicrobiia bacterium]|nr:hypothetical protein [Acidimicrobiia bacterium]MYJ32496.1 hypothetical protein [Acidimicrobiia bacterium]
MNIYDRATNLQVQLKAAIEAASSDELLTRGRNVRDELNGAVAYFEAVQSYKAALGIQDVPKFGGKGIRQPLGRFRGALSRYGPAAVQQQTAATLLESIKTEKTHLERWVKSIWKSRFDEFRSLLEKVESSNLAGSPDQRKVALSCASRLRRAQNTDPIRSTQELGQILDSTEFEACLEQIDVLGDELRRAIMAIEQEHATLTPEVQAVLERAGSGEGLPLAEITSDVLEALESAGVLDGLVVRRL